MGLININMPDNKGILQAINGHLYDISKNTERMGYSLEHIKKDVHRIADASEVVAGVKTKEEIQIEQAIKRIQDDDAIMSGLFLYEPAPLHIREESEANSVKINKLQQLQEQIKNERENELLKLSHECQEHETNPSQGSQGREKAIKKKQRRKNDYK